MTLAMRNDPPKKYIEPELRFISKRIAIGDDPDNKVLVAELVHKGHVLVEFSKLSEAIGKGLKPTPLATGPNTHFSADKSQVLASVAGYPKISYHDVPGQAVKTLVVSIEPLLKISQDRMKVTLAIHPPLAEGGCLHRGSLKKALLDAGIVFGVDHRKVRETVSYLAENLMEFSTVVIANGQQVGQSEDAYVLFAIEIGPIAGAIQTDGSIDFRERRIMVPVAAGQLIATKIPACQGDPGITVFGETVAAREGRDIVVRTANDARYSVENHQITAAAAGVLSVIGGTIIRVCSRQEIDGDIDYETGNVEAGNCLVIKGSIQPGFRVAAEGDMLINGSVMSAQVSSLANIVIKGGITGKKSQIEAQGDVDISFIEQGKIVAGGNVVVRKSCYYSTITSAGHIRCKASSKLIGGALIAAGSLTVGEVGTENANPALLAAGVDAERLHLFRELQKNLIAQQNAIIEWLEIHPGTNRSKKVREMEAEAATAKQQLLRLNMIPGTGLYSRADGSGSQFGGDQGEGDDIGGIAIEFFGTVEAGTRLQIGNRTMILDTTIANRTFKLNETGQKIIAAPLRRRRGSD